MVWGGAERGIGACPMMIPLIVALIVGALLCAVTLLPDAEIGE